VAGRTRIAARKGTVSTTLENEAIATVENEATQTDCSEDARGTVIVRHRRRPAGHRRGAAPAHVDTVRRLIFGTLSCDQVVALAQVSNQVLHQIGAVGGPGRRGPSAHRGPARAGHAWSAVCVLGRARRDPEIVVGIRESGAHAAVNTYHRSADR
jgi:hypothetical protein